MSAPNKEMIEKIEELVKEGLKPEIIEIDNKKFITKKISPILDPEPISLRIYTLTGIVDYLVNNNIDKLEIDRVMVHVVSPEMVLILSELTGDFLQRSQYIKAEYFSPQTPFGQWQSIDIFIVNLMALFEQTEQLKELLKIIGNLQDGIIKTVSDDGITQQLEVKTGVTRIEDVKIPNPIVLKPYRTFPEIEQPESPFVFRLKSGGDKIAPQAALFDADNGKWKLEAIQRIAAWLKDKLPDITIIA